MKKLIEQLLETTKALLESAALAEVEHYQEYAAPGTDGTLDYPEQSVSAHQSARDQFTEFRLALAQVVMQGGNCSPELLGHIMDYPGPFPEGVHHVYQLQPGDNTPTHLVIRPGECQAPELADRSGH